MSNKPYKDFEPKWITDPPVEKSYRSIMKWGDPAAYKRPKEGLYKLIKQTFNLTDDDFKEMVDVGNEVVDFKAPSRLTDAQLDELRGRGQRHHGRVQTHAGLLRQDYD